MGSYRPGTVVGIGDAHSNQAGCISLFTEPGANRDRQTVNTGLHGKSEGSDKKAAGTDVGRKPATTGRVFWRDTSRQHPIRDKQVWDWLEGIEMGEVSEAGTHLV